MRVIVGSQKGKEGKVMRVLLQDNKAFVEGLNIIKKHNKPNAQNPQGGIVEKEAPIHLSNLSLLTADGKTTRVGYRLEGDKKVRIAKKTDEVI